MSSFNLDNWPFSPEYINCPGMFMWNPRQRALRDAKAFGVLVAQLKKPYALVMNDVVVACDEIGAELIKTVQDGHAPGEELTWFDPVGHDRYFRPTRHDMTHGSFRGVLWLFENVSEYLKTIEDLESRARHLESEHRMYSEARTNLGIPVWITGTNNQLYYHNQAYANMFGQSLPASIRNVVKEGVRGTAPSQTVVPAIIDGSRRQLEINIKPLSHGRMLVWALDRTEELEILGGRDRIMAAQRGLFEQLHTAVAMYDQSAKLSFYNSAYAHMWGLDEAYLNGKPSMGETLDKLRAMRRLPEQADFKSYKQDWLRLFTELMGPREDMLYLPDGHTVRVLTVPNPAGGLFMTFEDVTTTLELESSLNTVLAVQRETLDHMTEAVAVFGSDGRLKLWNPQYAKMWNLYPEVLSTSPHISALVEAKIRVFSKDKRDAMKRALLMQALERHEMKGRFETEDGRQINHMSIPLPDGATLLTYDDVTDTHQVEKALRDKAAALEAAERLKLDFLANVSYQLRTPLNAIIGFAELLEHQYFGTLNQKQIDYAKGITEAGQRLLSPRRRHSRSGDHRGGLYGADARQIQPRRDDQGRLPPDRGMGAQVAA